MILAGDIGGTKTNLAWFDWREGRPVYVRGRRFSSHDYPGLEPILAAFLDEVSYQASAACFGVAGVVTNTRCETTNLPWVVEENTLRDLLGISRVSLINDVEATALSIPVLKADELLVVQEGVEQEGNMALIAVGTGLGESLLVRTGDAHVPCATEGGHTDFGPRNEWEMGLFRFLRQRFGHVSYERILAGEGFGNLFDFVCSSGGVPAPEVVAALAAADDRAPIISRAGIDGSCKVCREVVDRFVEIYGAEAGNLALKSLAFGGVYLGGGIAPRIAPRMRGDNFLKGFLDKGRFRKTLERMPVKLILNPEAALMGAARVAFLSTDCVS